MRGEPELAGKWNAPAPAEECSSSRALGTLGREGRGREKNEVYRRGLCGMTSGMGVVRVVLRRTY